MALTYGFYNSLSGDRKYNAVQISEMFDGIINDGIYESIGDKFIVRASTGMKVTVGSGRAFFKHTWTKNDAQIVLTVPASNVVLNRIDTVVLEVNSDPGVRANSIKIVSGTPANNPQAPTMVHSEYVNQYPLANIYVGADVTAITQSNITNRRGTSACPFVTGILQVTSIDNLIAQWVAEWDEWLSSTNSEYTAWKNATQTDFTTWSTNQKTAFVEWMTESKAGFNNWMTATKNDFDDWFANLQYVLDGDVAGHLQNEIENNADAISANATLSKSSDTALYQFRRCTHNAVYDKLVGISYVKNQLLKNGNFASTANWTTAAATISVNNNILSFTATGTNGSLQQQVSRKAKHKYLFMNSVKMTTANPNIRALMAYDGNNWSIANTIQDTNWHNYYLVINQRVDDATISFTRFVQDSRGSGWDTISVKNCMCIDLTLMFGTAIADKIYTMEQATAGSGLAWIRQYGFLNNTYIEYNAGAIESSAPTVRKVVGFNQWDEEWESGNINLTTGQNQTGGGYLRSKNYQKCIPNTSYYCLCPSANFPTCVMCFYDSDKNYLSHKQTADIKRKVFVTPANASYFRFYFYTETYNHDICINISDPTKNGTYEPYKEVTYPLGGDTLRGVPQLVGDDLVADGDVKTSDGVVNGRYTKVDLGTLNFAYNNGIFYVALSPAPVYFPSRAIGNAICSKYVAAEGNTTVADKCFTIFSYYLRIADSAYTDAATFKTAMSGQYLVYEKATPTSSVSTPFTSPQVSLATEETDTICGHDSVVVDIPGWMQNEYFDDVRADANMAHGVQTALYELDSGEDSLMNEGIRYPVINGIRNYVDANGVYHKNLGCVDLGTLNWGLGIGITFTAPLPGLKYQTNTALPLNAICGMYTQVSKDYFIGEGANVNLIMRSNNAEARIYANNAAYSNAAAFKTAMSGVLLFYELATPQTWNTKSAIAIKTIQQSSDWGKLSEGTNAILLNAGVVLGNSSVSESYTLTGNCRGVIVRNGNTLNGVVMPYNSTDIYFVGSSSINGMEYCTKAVLGGKKIVVCPEAQRGSDANTLYFCY